MAFYFVFDGTVDVAVSFDYGQSAAYYALNNGYFAASAAQLVTGSTPNVVSDVELLQPYGLYDVEQAVLAKYVLSLQYYRVEFPFWVDLPPPTTITISDNTGATYSGVTDTQLLSRLPTTNYGTNTIFEATNWDSTDIVHGLVKFDGLSSVPSGTAANAKLRLWVSAFFSTPNTQVYGMLRDFVESQATWNEYSTGNSWGTAGANNTTTDYSNTLLSSLSITVTAQYVEFTGAALTAWVQAIVSGGANLPLQIRDISEPATPLNIGVQYVTSEGLDGRRPELVFDLVASGGGGSTTVVSNLGVAGTNTSSKKSTTTAASKLDAIASSDATKKAATAASSSVGVAGSTTATASGGSPSGSTSVASRLGSNASSSAVKASATNVSSRLGTKDATNSKKSASNSAISSVGIKSANSAIKNGANTAIARIGAKANVTAAKSVSTTVANKLGLSTSTSATAFTGTQNGSTSVISRSGITGATTSGKQTNTSILSRLGLSSSNSVSNVNKTLSPVHYYTPKTTYSKIVKPIFVAPYLTKADRRKLKQQQSLDDVASEMLPVNLDLSAVITKKQSANKAKSILINEALLVSIRAEKSALVQQMRDEKQAQEDEAILLMMFEFMD